MISRDVRNTHPACNIPIALDRSCSDKLQSFIHIYRPRSDKRDLMAIKVKSEIFTEKERPSYCEQLLKFEEITFTNSKVMSV